MTAESSDVLADRAETQLGYAAANLERAADAWRREQAALPLEDRLIHASALRCVCGAAMAIDPAAKGEAVFGMSHLWQCAALLMLPAMTTPSGRRMVTAKQHSDPVPVVAP